MVWCKPVFKEKKMTQGDKFKLLRGNMTQAELAKRSDVDKAIISKIESGKMPGTVESHRKIAQVFGLKLSELYAYLEDGRPEQIEFRSGDSKTDTYQDFLEILSSLPLSKKMLPTFITLKPGEEKFLEETTRRSERFIIILEGEIEIETSGKTYKLKKLANLEKGDNIYSKSLQRHRIKNTGSRIARALCISSPPIL
jgi:transcriptional regulator with XRE-family HTH domain